MNKHYRHLEIFHKKSSKSSYINNNHLMHQSLVFCSPICNSIVLLVFLWVSLNWSIIIGLSIVLHYSKFRKITCAKYVFSVRFALFHPIVLSARICERIRRTITRQHSPQATNTPIIAIFFFFFNNEFHISNGSTNIIQ